MPLDAPSPRASTLNRALGSPHFVWVILALSLAMGLASLGNGLLADDYLHQRMIVAQRLGHVDTPWWDLFVLAERNPQRTIGMRTAGRYPWWVDPDLGIAFFRPLSAATHQLDYLLWPGSARLMHAHSLAWHAGVCAAGWALARRLVDAPRVAGLAALVYALSFTHVVPWSWLAHRNGLVSSFFALACVLAHVHWRAEGKRWAAFVAPLLLAAALLGAEAGIVTLALLIAYELLRGPGGPAQRVLALAPALLTVVAWRLSYEGLGYGVVGSGGYIDPIAEPGAFLSALPTRYGTLLALSLGAPFLALMPAGLWVAASLAAGLALMVFTLGPAGRGSTARLGLLATALGCVPLAASLPVDRVLTLTSFGVALAVAELIDAWALRPASLLAKVAAGCVGAVHLLAPVPAGLYLSTHLELLHSGHGDAYGPSLPNAGLGRKGLVIVHAPHYPAADNLAANRAFRGLEKPNFVWILHSGPVEPEVTCLDAQSLELREPAFGWFGGGFASQFRNARSKPFATGDSVRTLDHVATVTEVDEGRPTAVRFEFRTRLDHRSFAWARWEGEEFVPTHPRALCASSAQSGPGAP